MTNKFEKVKEYYESGYWTKAMVANAVVKGWITQEQYEQIVNNN